MGRAGISTNAPYIFLHFSQQYTVHILARREKNRAGFSHVRIRIRSNEFSPSNICLYTIAATLCGSGQAWRLESAVGIYLPRIGANLAKIVSDGVTWL